MMNVKSLVLVAVALVCGMSWSMPSKADLKTAEKKAAELMRSDLEALKAGSQTKLGMGETAYVLAEQAKDEAMRCVLLAGALHYFVAAGEAARADAAFGALRAGVADLPPSFVADLLARELSGRKGTGCLFEALEHARRQLAYKKEAEQLVAELRKFPGNSVARRRLAECRALSGDWPAALAAFAELKGERVQAVAVCERHPAKAEKQFTAGEIAAFWWSYPTDNPDGRLTGFKVHAADWYRRALAGQAADGLDALLMQKRVAFVDSPSPTQFAAMRKPQPKKPEGTVTEASKPATSIPAAPATIATVPRTFHLNKDVKLDFLPVPAGKFRMPASTDGTYFKTAHDVTITRPFWATRMPVTIEVWCAGGMGDSKALREKYAQDRAFQALGGMKAPASGSVGLTADRARAFCEKLNSRFADALPPGYVFRLPTIAEYVYMLDCSFPGMFRNGGFPGDLSGVLQDQVAGTGGKNNVLEGFKDVRWELKISMPDLFSQLRPDRRGFVGLVQGGGMLFLDQFLPTGGDSRYIVRASYDRDGKFVSAAVSYSPARREVDPVGCDEGPSSCYLVGYGTAKRDSKGRYKEFGIWGPIAYAGGWLQEKGVFRVVLGPDLLAEKKKGK